MGLLANIDRLASAGGIIALAVDTPDHPRAFRGTESWAPILESAMQLLAKTGENTIRLVVGKHTVILQQEDREVVAVVLPTGHAIAKSLRRMIRRMSKKEQGARSQFQGQQARTSNPTGPTTQTSATNQPQTTVQTVTPANPTAATNTTAGQPQNGMPRPQPAAGPSQAPAQEHEAGVHPNS